MDYKDDLEIGRPGSPQRPARISFSRVLALVGIFLYLGCLYWREPAASVAVQDSSFRLGRHVVPSHYSLKIQTDLEDLTFDGTSTIDVSVRKHVDRITLNAAPPLNIIEASFNSDEASLTHFDYEAELERVTLFFGSTVKPGNYKLGFLWHAEILDSFLGYYRCNATSPQDPQKTISYAVTQFESVQARRAFPSFDEPDFKANFSISLISREGTTSLANSAPRKTDESPSLIVSKPGSWYETQFETTPLLSSYLVAFANGPFKSQHSSYISPLSGRKVPLGGYSTWEYSDDLGLALNLTRYALPYYEKLFNIEYFMPKADFLGVESFDFGAMENAGLVIGRLALYTYNEDVSGIQVKEGVVTVHAHELAHQWFGNIVTLAWWDDLWLNEAFATFISTLAVNDLEPSWRLAESFVAKDYSTALALDALDSSHPISVHVKDARDIQQIFDGITYSKGASILRQIHSYVGHDVFIKGVTRYLNAHVYGNARTSDLWAAISHVADRDISAFAHTWLTEKGFPIVTVSVKDGSVSLSQSKFRANVHRSDVSHPTWYIPGDVSDLMWQAPYISAPIWQIPISIRELSSNTTTSFLLSERHATLDLPVSDGQVYKINWGTTGFYRTLYDSAYAKKIASFWDSGLTPVDKMGFISDLFAHAASGYLPSSTALSIALRLRGEKDPLVWQTSLASLAKLSQAFRDDERISEGINSITLSLVAPLVARLGLFDSPEDDLPLVTLRPLILQTAVDTNSESIVHEFKTRFDQYIKGNHTAAPPNLRKLIFSVGIRFGGAPDFDALLHLARTTETPAIRLAALAALAGAQDSSLVDRAIGMTLSGDVLAQDVPSYILSLSQNPKAANKLWLFFKKHYDDFNAIFDRKLNGGAVVKNSFLGLSSRDQLQDVISFFSGKDTQSFNLALEQGIELIDARISWVERDTEDLRSWLSHEHNVF